MTEEIMEARDEALLKVLRDYIDGKAVSKEESDQQKIIVNVAKVIAEDCKRQDDVAKAEDSLELERDKLEIERDRLDMERTDREFRRGIDDDRMNNEHDADMARIDIENSKLALEEKNKGMDIKVEKWKLIFGIGGILLKAGLMAIDRNAVMHFEQTGILRSAAWKHILGPKNL